ncbi:acetate--CoA ligase family protein [Nanoarchaeota archaeon]
MKALTQVESDKLIRSYAPLARSLLTNNVSEALRFSDNFPLVLKIISPDAIHKTDICGVTIVNSKEGLEKSYSELVENSKKRGLKLNGILVQEFVKGQELIIGLKNDQTFGHVILLGIGGVLVEVLDDVSFRVCPITEDDAESMINDLKAKDVLLKPRDHKKINLGLLKKTLVSVSKIPSKHKNIEELDINPFVLNDKEGKVADARIVLG